MPTFFILSGMCTDWHKDSIANFVKRRIKSLLLPFLIYSLIVILISQWSDLYLFSLTNGWRGYALWFVPVFMLALIMSKLYFTITNGVFRIIFFVLLILTASYLSYSGTHLPWSISSVPYSAILVISGYYLKRFADYITKLRIVYIILSMAIVAAISYFFRLDIAWNIIIPIVPITIAAIAGTGMLINISCYIEKFNSLISKLCVYIGRETFVIMAFSQLIIILISLNLQLTPIFKYLLLLILLFLLINLKKTLCLIFKEFIISR